MSKDRRYYECIGVDFYYEYRKGATTINIHTRNNETEAKEACAMLEKKGYVQASYSVGPKYKLYRVHNNLLFEE